jgi:PhnB protein
MATTSKVKAVPEGAHTVTPYLVVTGVARLIEFTKQVFGAEETFLSRRPDGSIAHAEVKIGNSKIMLGEGQNYKSFPGMLHLYMEDCDGIYRRAMEAGAKSLREPADQLHGDRMAGVEDPFGNQWWIATHIEDVSAEEMERRMKAANG